MKSNESVPVEEGEREVESHEGAAAVVAEAEDEIDVEVSPGTVEDETEVVVDEADEEEVEEEVVDEVEGVDATAGDEEAASAVVCGAAEDGAEDRVEYEDEEATATDVATDDA